MKRAFLLFTIALSMLQLTGCNQYCNSDQVYYARFSFVNRQTGRPYFALNDSKSDSLQVYENSGNIKQLLSINKRVDPIKGYVFGDVDLIDLTQYVLYIKFNDTDQDTLIINNQIIRGQKQCSLSRYTTTASYNGRSLKSVSSDTTSFVYFELMK